MMKTVEAKEMIIKAKQAVRHVNQEAMIVVNVTNSRISFTGISSRMVIEVSKKCENPSSEIRCMVNAKRLSDVVSRFPEDEIVFRNEDNALLLIGNKVKISIPIQAGEVLEVPVLEDETVSFEIEASAIKECYHSTSGSSGDPLRSSYNIKTGPDCCQLTTLDGSRISKRGACPGTPTTDIVVDRDLLLFMSSLGESIEFHSDGKWIYAESEGTKVWGAILPEAYYNIAALTENHSSTAATVNKSEIIAALIAATLIDMSDPKIVFKVANNKISIENLNKRYGHSYAETEAAVTGKDVDAIFNGRLLLDALKSMPEGSVLSLSAGQCMRIENVEHRSLEVIAPIVMTK